MFGFLQASRSHTEVRADIIPLIRKGNWVKPMYPRGTVKSSMHQLAKVLGVLSRRAVPTSP